MVGEALMYVTCVDEAWGSAGMDWPRDQWIGWIRSHQREHLLFVTNNIRFLILLLEFRR